MSAVFVRGKEVGENMKKIFLLIILIFCSFFLTGQEDTFIRHLHQNIHATEIFQWVETLSSPEYEGRLTGTDGYNKAVQLAVNHFKKYGLRPLDKKNGYTQTFPLPYTKVYEAVLALSYTDAEGGPQTMECKYFKDFYPLGFSGSGDVQSKVVFAGYGISAQEFQYDDYKDLDVAGKIVMIIKGAPKAAEGEDWSRYDSHRFRTRNAREHGAAGLLYITSPRGNPNGDYQEQFPMVQLHPGVADKLLKKYGKTVKSLKKELNNRQFVSFVTQIDAHLTVKSEHFQGEGINPVAYIPGTDSKLRGEFIIIGAHLDHCGMWPRLKPGADDNASGSAVLMAVAKAMATSPIKPRRSVLFVLFAGEEMGLLGSTYFVTFLNEKIKDIKFVFNMDMVGAGPDVFILRLKNYPEVEEIAMAVPGLLNLDCRVKGNKIKKPRPQGGADHAPFVKKGFPAVSVFSSGGDHHGYHTDQDTIYWITPKIMEDIAKMIAYSTMKIANN